MALVYSINDELESIRSSATYEWAFAIFVANFTIQVYRLVAQLTTFTFDIFKLRYGVDLFWPLTTDDLRPYTHYFIEQDETVLKLLESLVLSLGAFYGASSLLRYTIVGLALYAIIFFIHSVISILGLFFVVGEFLQVESRL